MNGPFALLVTRRAEKDIARLTPKHREKLRVILTEVIAADPFRGKRLVGDLAGYFSYRLTYKDRIVYRIDEKTRRIYIMRAASHYGD